MDISFSSDQNYFIMVLIYDNILKRCVVDNQLVFIQSQGTPFNSMDLVDFF